MSLNKAEEAATREELSHNFALAGRSAEQIAEDLHTDADRVRRTLVLDAERIEDPWILRNYLSCAIEEKGETPIPYSKLVGDPADYWFLDARYIAEGVFA
jgi:hypothetical protein